MGHSWPSSDSDKRREIHQNRRTQIPVRPYDVPLAPNGDSGWNPNILYRTNDERREAEGEEDDEEDPYLAFSKKEPDDETAAEAAEDHELEFEETLVDPEDQSASRRLGNEIVKTIIIAFNLLLNVL